MQNWRLLMALSLLAGYVDTAGFLALHGLFTAHVTGNFVTMGAALTHGSSGAVAKLLALPNRRPHAPLRPGAVAGRTVGPAPSAA